VSAELLTVVAAVSAAVAGGLAWLDVSRRRWSNERFMLHLQAEELGLDTRQARSLRHLRSLVNTTRLARDLGVEPAPQRRGPWRGRPGSWRLPPPATLPVEPPVRTAGDASSHLQKRPPTGHDLPPLDDPLTLHDRADQAGLAGHIHATEPSQ
jgi:hypothetical protein